MSQQLGRDTRSFDAYLQQAVQPVLVDFWAPWCAPCRMLAPVLEQLGAELEGRLDVVKVNVDEMSELARRFEVRSIPTLILFEHGQPRGQRTGVQPVAALRDWVQSVTDLETAA